VTSMSRFRRLAEQVRRFSRTPPADELPQPEPQPRRRSGPQRHGTGPPVFIVDPRLPEAVSRFVAAEADATGTGADGNMVAIAPLLEGEPARRTGAAVWWWIDQIDSAVIARLEQDPGEAILVPGEQERHRLELAVPGSIGNIWVAGASSPDVADIVARYYPSRDARFRLGVIGYNLKFIMPIVSELIQSPGVSATIDEWPRFASGPTGVTDRVLAASDVVLCEWCGPNAIYASQNRRPGQRLVVRLHRFELETDYWKAIDPETVDKFIAVGEHYRNRILDQTGWPADKVTVLPNQVDDLQLRRPKLPGARFNIGVLGMSSKRKRLDIALDVAEALAAADSRFRLLIKSAHPEDEKWVWDRPQEREYFTGVLPRLEKSPLAEMVTWESFGQDVAAWLRKIGFILSVSDDESFHLAPAEGMAAGSVPIIRAWPGADSVYSPHWVLDDCTEMVDRITSLASNHTLWEQESQRAEEEAFASFSMSAVVARWAALLAPRPAG
jgi:glycosyltransferase involved in cell wall biosynthesis